MAQHSNADKESLWLERIRLWRQSQLSVRAFCAHRRLREPSFYSWRRLLRERGLIDDGPSAQAAPRAPTPAFIKIAVDNAASGSAVSGSAIDLVLAAGRILRVRAGFDPELLRQLVRLLEESAC